MGPEGAITLSKALKDNTTLIRLDLGGMPQQQDKKDSHKLY